MTTSCRHKRPWLPLQQFSILLVRPRSLGPCVSPQNRSGCRIEIVMTGLLTVTACPAVHEYYAN